MITVSVRSFSDVRKLATWKATKKGQSRIGIELAGGQSRLVITGGHIPMVRTKNYQREVIHINVNMLNVISSTDQLLSGVVE